MGNQEAKGQITSGAARSSGHLASVVVGQVAGQKDVLLRWQRRTSPPPLGLPWVAQPHEGGAAASSAV